MTGIELKELKLNHYGDIGDRELKFDSGLNAFFGKNESGKTLIVEAMTKMLLEDRSIFQDIDRVENEPNGILKIVKNGKELDASQEGLDTIFEGATAEDVRNAFIIRDFDLRLPERKNDFGTEGYFGDVTDRILGSRTQEIQALREEIAEIGLLTNDTTEKNPDLTNSKTGKGKLRNRRADAEDLIEDIEKFRKKEVQGENILEKYSQLNDLKDEIRELEETDRKLSEAKKEQKYEKGLQLIEKLEDAIDREEKIEVREKRLDNLEALKEDIIKTQEIDEPASGLDKEIALGALIATIILAASTLLAPIVFIGALVMAAVSIYFGRRYNSTQAQIQEKENSINEILDELDAEGLEAETLKAAEKKIEEFKQDLEQERDENVKDIQDKESKLEGEFDRSGDSLEDWKKIVESFSEEFEETDLDYSEERVKEVEQEIQELETEIEEKEEELETYNQKITDFNNRYHRIPVQKFTDHGEIEIETVDDLPEAVRHLEDFVDHLEEIVESTIEAIKILEEMESEEEDEFNSMFKDGSYAVEMFKEATDGNYIDINYDKAAGTLKVEKSDGPKLKPEKLSQGTYDLLYMSIRLGIAREILDEPGFLILDNAFAHSDIERVEKEVDFLKELEEEGWQIIYLTYRDDVRDVLEDITSVHELERL